MRGRGSILAPHPFVQPDHILAIILSFNQCQSQEGGVNLGPRLQHKVDEPQRVGLPQPRQRRQVLFYISAERSTMFKLKTGGLLASQPKGREFQMWEST